MKLDGTGASRTLMASRLVNKSMNYENLAMPALGTKSLLHIQYLACRWPQLPTATNVNNMCYRYPPPVAINVTEGMTFLEVNVKPCDCVCISKLSLSYIMLICHQEMSPWHIMIIYRHSLLLRDTIFPHPDEATSWYFIAVLHQDDTSPCNIMTACTSPWSIIIICHHGKCHDIASYCTLMRQSHCTSWCKMVKASHG